MKDDTIAKAGCFLASILVTVSVSFGIVYTVIHFIVKWW